MIGVVVGSYQLVKKLGEGGMGAVYLGQHTLLGRRAAVKVLLPALSARPDIVSRFFNEARAVTSISDPGIVQVFDFGYHSDGAAFIVMEYLEGEALDQRLAKLRRFAVPDALRLCRQVATSLAAAHAQHIIHRDLKPENIFLVRDAEVASGERSKILDFGIAKLSDEDPSKIKTHVGALMGTPVYMSPEQCRGLPEIDHRADIYALACVVFHLITGRPPFDGAGMGDLILAHVTEPAPAASSFVSGVPPSVDALLMRCMAKSPDDRFASMTELTAAITLVLQQLASDGVPGFAYNVDSAPFGRAPSVTPVPGMPGKTPAPKTPAPSSLTPVPMQYSRPPGTPPPAHYSQPPGTPPPGMAPGLAPGMMPGIMGQGMAPGMMAQAMTQPPSLPPPPTMPPPPSLPPPPMPGQVMLSPQLATLPPQAQYATLPPYLSGGPTTLGGSSGQWSPTAPPPSPQASKTRRWIIGVLAVGCVAGVVIGIASTRGGGNGTQVAASDIPGLNTTTQPEPAAKPRPPAPAAAPVPAPAPAPAPAQPAAVEPAPAPVQPAAVEPAPAPVQPAAVEPAPAPVQPAPVEPAPAPVQPAAVAPAPTQPAAAPAPVEPAPPQPAAASPTPPQPAPAPAPPAPHTPSQPAPTPSAPTTSPSSPPSASDSKATLARKCGKPTFASVYDAVAPGATAVHAALKTLRQCHEVGAVSNVDFDRYQVALVAKL